MQSPLATQPFLPLSLSCSPSNTLSPVLSPCPTLEPNPAYYHTYSTQPTLRPTTQQPQPPPRAPPDTSCTAPYSSHHNFTLPHPPHCARPQSQCGCETSCMRVCAGRIEGSRGATWCLALRPSRRARAMKSCMESASLERTMSDWERCMAGACGQEGWGEWRRAV